MIFQTLSIYVFPRDKCVCIRIVLLQNLPFLSMKRFVKASNMPLNFNEKSATLKWMYKLFKSSSTIVCTPLFSAGGVGGGGLSLRPNFQKARGALTGSQFLEGGCWERGGGDFFHGVAAYT